MLRLSISHDCSLLVVRRHLIFDLDGTLIDSRIGIVRCVNYALESCGLPAIDDSKDTAWLVGPPLQENFGKLVGHDIEGALTEKLIEAYRKRFESTGIFENSLVPGIEELVRELRRDGKRLTVATTKPTPYARRIIEHHRLDHIFEMVIGSEFNGLRSSKDELIKYVIESSGDDTTYCLVIGDRESDVLAAKRANIDSVGVLYGYGTRPEIMSSEPTFVADNVQQLADLLRRM